MNLPVSAYYLLAVPVFKVNMHFFLRCSGSVSITVFIFTQLCLKKCLHVDCLHELYVKVTAVAPTVGRADK